MIERGSFGILILLLLLSLIGDLVAVTIIDHYRNNEYILEHQVTYEDAIVEARKLKIYPGPIPGCKACTSAEMTYCQDGSVISDHCCCEGGYNKVFPFVEHECRVSRQPCKVLADDCAEYTRLRECCCNSYLSSLWKYLAGGAANPVSNLSAIMGAFVILRIIIDRLLQ